MLELTLRLVFSLAVVVGLLLLVVHFGGRRFAGRSDALVQVVHRQQLNRSSSVAVVTVGSKVLVLGATEHQVSLLTELDPEEFVTPEQVDAALAAETDQRPAGVPGVRSSGGRTVAVGSLPGALARTRTTGASGALGGSLLSPETWKQAVGALSSMRRPR